MPPLSNALTGAGQARPSHVVFMVPELLSLILMELDDQTLARMARVSTFTHEQSIEHLWGRPSWDNLNKLVRLFPAEKVLRSADGAQWTLHHSLEEPDWARFKHYSVYVTMHQAYTPFKLSHLSFSHFFNRASDLFPSLQKISVTWPSVLDYPNAEWFAIAGSKLRVLDISTPFPSQPPPNTANLVALNSLLQKLPFQAPFLERLSLPAFKHDDTTPPARKYLVATFGTVLPALTHLQEFSWLWAKIPVSIIQPTITTHPRLDNLKFCHAPLLLPGTTPSFNSLTRLHLSDSTEKVAKSWLGALSRPDLLKAVELLLVGESSGSPPPAIPEFIAPLIQATNLAEIHIKFPKSRLISWTSVEPLLVCSSLSTFHLTLESPLDGLDDATLEKLAISWRELEALTIVESAFWTDDFQPAVTLFGLKSLATYCLKLRRISLMVSSSLDNSRLQDVLDQYQGTPNLKSGTLERLDLRYSRFGTQMFRDELHEDFLDLRSIAQTLRAFWPALSHHTLCSGWSGFGETTMEVVMAQRFDHVRDILLEMNLQEESERSLRLVFEEEKTRLTEENNRLIEENGDLADELANLRRELANAGAER